MRNLTINMTSSCTDHNLSQAESSWEEVLELLQVLHHHGTLTLEQYLSADSNTKKLEKDSIGWIPCSLKDAYGRRQQENIDMAHLLVLDIDYGLSAEQVREILGDYEYALHSTYSHSPSKPKWRVVLPLHEPIPAKSLPALFDQVNILFGGKLDVSCGHDCARMYYLPACPPDAKDIYHFEHHAGKWLNSNELDEAIDLSPAAKYTGDTKTVPAKETIDFETGYPDGQRTHELTRRAGYCFYQGMSLEETKSLCLKWNALNMPPLDQKKVTDTVDSIAKTHFKNKIEMPEDYQKVVNEMNRHYAWIERHGTIYRSKYRDFISVEKLRQQFANTHVWGLQKGKPKDLTHAEAWIASPDRRKFDDVVFEPGKPDIHNGSINLWRGWGVKPKEGDITPWNELLDYIFNGSTDMRNWFECWIAYPIQHPGEKLNTAVVLWSPVQGVGKSLIGETIGQLYGEHFKIISAAELHGKFNSWFRDCQFVLGEENSSSDHRADANKLKHLITGAMIFVEEKYQPSMTMQNRVNFLFTSNHPDAFHLEAHDRRFFVWAITSVKMSDEFYRKFVEWRNTGGNSALMHHFLHIDLKDFNPKANAPVTESKQDMIEISRTDVERWINDTLDDPATIKTVIGKEIVTMDDLTRAYHREHSHSRCNTTAMSRALRRKHKYAQRRIMTPHGRKSLITLTRHNEWDLCDNSTWVDEYKKPSSIGW